MIFAFIILGISFIFVVGVLIFMTDGALGGLDFTTDLKVVKNIAGIIAARHLETGNFYDLGSCRGGLAIKISKNLPNLQVKGFDNSWYRVLLAKARSLFLKNLAFKKENIFETDVSSVSIVFLYLPKELMPALETKLQKELKPGAIVIANRTCFPNWQVTEKLQELTIYQQS